MPPNNRKVTKKKTKNGTRTNGSRMQPELFVFDERGNPHVNVSLPHMRRMIAAEKKAKAIEAKARATKERETEKQVLKEMRKMFTEYKKKHRGYYRGIDKKQAWIQFLEYTQQQFSSGVSSHKREGDFDVGNTFVWKAQILGRTIQKLKSQR